MAKLTPDATRTEHGLVINEKIIPWGAVWPKDSGAYKKGAQYKADRLLSGGTGKVKGVTIHNTNDLKNVEEDAEQYTRATWPNGNMNDARVHYYVDDINAWQNLREDEVGWHAGDGRKATGGNETTLSMKKIVSLALTLMMVLSLTACGSKDGGDSADPNLGKYIGQNVTSSEDSDWLSMDDVYDEGDNYIELKSGGKGEFCLDGDKETIKWSLAADGTLKLTGNNVESTGTLKDGLITLNDYWGIDLIMTFLKEGAEMSAQTGTKLLDWWNGDWFGWWKMTDCSGYYEDMEGDWWDICGTIDIGADNKGTVTLWDEDYTKDSPMAMVNVSLSGSGTGEHGTMMSEGGQFTDVKLEHAEWIIDPGTLDCDDLIRIDGYYENGEDGYHYEIYLRPWGTYWDDVDEGTHPYSYDDWYLPLIKAGKPMPDSIGADAR